jgi:hypothetical protein
MGKHEAVVTGVQSKHMDDLTQMLSTLLPPLAHDTFQWSVIHTVIYLVLTRGFISLVPYLSFREDAAGGNTVMKVG